MGKLDELMRTSRGIAAESMGARRSQTHSTMHSASAPVAAAAPDHLQGITRSRNAAEIPLDKLDRDPDQPREEFDEESLARLAASMQAKGQLQPIRVRWDEGRGVYLIVCGERRWRAAKIAGMATMTCVIMDGPIASPDLLALQLVENMLREDLRPIEQARAFRILIDRNGWSTRQLAAELAITQSDVVRALALLELPPPVQEQVEQGELSPSTAYEISKAPDVESQVEVAARVVADGLTRSEAIEAVRQAAGRRSSQKTRKGKGAKARKVTERTFRTSDGYRITVENRRGIELASLAAALRETFDRVEAEIRDGEVEGAAA